MNGEIVSIDRLFQSKVLLFRREAQILTAVCPARGVLSAPAKPQKASCFGAIRWLVWTDGDLVLPPALLWRNLTAQETAG
jgi:hypothetical protein